MGLKASTTCELTFGEHGVPAKGWLLGDVHDGIRQMFTIIEYARMMVGTKAIATLSTGYLNALDYAKSRVQGADLTRQSDKSAPRVTITHHPDVRRSLMTQKAYAEGLRWHDGAEAGGYARSQFRRLRIQEWSAGPVVGRDTRAVRIPRRGGAVFRQNRDDRDVGKSLAAFSRQTAGDI
jgi:alkylation response protein AidB-like acyl-CoA dehydrogenase